RLEPAMRRLGWTPRAGEPANDAVLRNDLIGTLGGLGHPQTLAEANRRFAANDPSVQGGPMRTTILGIVAYNADEATWERFARMAGGSADPAMVDKLNEYAARYLTPQSRGEVDRAIAGINDRLRVRRERLPQITRWLEARRGA